MVSDISPETLDKLRQQRHTIAQEALRLRMLVASGIGTPEQRAEAEITLQRTQQLIDFYDSHYKE